MTDPELLDRLEALTGKVDEARRLAEEAYRRAAATTAEDGSASETLLAVKRQRDLSRRRMITGVGAVTALGVGGGKIVATEWSANLGADAINDLVGRGTRLLRSERLQFSQEFIDAAISFTGADLDKIPLEKSATAIGDAQRTILSAAGVFRRGHQVPELLISALENILAASADDLATRFLTVDLLSAIYVRNGLGRHARELWKYVDVSRLGSNPKLAVGYLDKTFNLNYTQLRPERALDTYQWDFGKGLTLASQALDLGSLGLALSAPAGRWVEARVVSAPDERALANHRARHGAPGLYALSWIYLFAAACDPDNAADMAVIQHHILEAYAREDPAAHRSVWNLAFVAGLQLHRQWERGPRHDLKAARDRMLRLCTDHNDSFWGGQTPDRFGRSLQGGEVMPIFAATFFNTTPGLCLSMARVPPLRELEQLKDDVKPQRLRAALDLIGRKRRNEPSSASNTFESHAIGDPTLGVYLQPAEQLQRAVA